MNDTTAQKPKGPGGRKKGGKNKNTIEREAQARLENERTQRLRDELRRLDEERGTDSITTEIAAAKTAGVKLAKDVLRDIMQITVGRAALFQPWPEAKGRKNPNEDVPEFYRNLELAIDVAKALVPFESPRLSAVMVGAAIVTEIEVTGGLPDDQDGGLNASIVTIDNSPETVSKVSYESQQEPDDQSGPAPRIAGGEAA